MRSLMCVNLSPTWKISKLSRPNTVGDVFFRKWANERVVQTLVCHDDVAGSNPVRGFFEASLREISRLPPVSGHP